MKQLIHVGHDMRAILIKGSCAMVKAVIPHDSIRSMLYDGSLSMHVLSHVGMMMQRVDELQIVGLKNIMEMEGWQELIFTCLTNCVSIHTLVFEDTALASDDVKAVTEEMVRQFLEVYPDRTLRVGTISDVYIPAAL